MSYSCVLHLCYLAQPGRITVAHDTVELRDKRSGVHWRRQTLPEAQRTKAIEAKTLIISAAKTRKKSSLLPTYPPPSQ